MWDMALTVKIQKLMEKQVDKPSQSTVMHPVLEEGPGNIKRKQVSSRDLCDIPLG
jgi:hypothetical protein